jgi:hypothetical protein
MRRRDLGGDFWPAFADRHLVIAAVAPAEQARAAWKAVEPTIDIETLDPGRFEVLPLIGARADVLDVAGDLRPRLAGILRHTWVRNQLARASTRDASGILDAVGARPMAIRDVSMALGYHEHLSHRPVGVVDLVVAPSRAERALDALAGHGWSRSRPRPSWRSRLVEGPEGVLVRVHHGPPPELRPVPPPGEGATWWRDTATIDVDGTAVDTLTVTDELLSIVARGARAGSGVPLVWVTDAVVLLRTAGDRIDWNDFVTGAARIRQTLTARAALRYLRELDVVAIPDTVEATLESVPVRASERAVWLLASNGATVFGGLPRTLADHGRTVMGEGPVTAVASLPRSLAEAWQTDGTRATAGAALQRLRRRARRENHDNRRTART